MKFIVVLIALLIERFFDWSHLRRWSWFAGYQRMLAQRFSSQSPYLVLAISAFSVAFGVLVVSYALDNILYGLFDLIFSLAILIYCLGPQNLWADGYACINALAQGDVKTASEKLKSTFVDGGSQATSRHFLNALFVEANRRVFAVVFWFMIFGPAGAILYRAAAVAAENASAANSAASDSASMVEGILDWLPARIFTFIFALSGHFVQTLQAWRKRVMLGVVGNDILLTECGVAALGEEGRTAFPEDGSAEKQAIGLLDRSFVISLVVIAIVSIVF